nr:MULTISPECIES: LysR family transcriptional regulator [unclassified Devosia]
MKFFLEVARVGTLSGAARILLADHATVSRRITALEQALGRSLFQRGTNGYALTAAGEDLLLHAEQMEVLALRSSAGSDVGSAIGGVVRIVTADGFGNFYLAERLASFAQTNPRLSVQLVPIQQIQSQNQRDGDIGVTLTPGGPRFVAERLADYGLGLYASKSYLHEHGTPEARAALSKHRFIGYIEDLLFSRELDYLDEVSPGLRAQLQFSSLLGQVEATLGNAGICVLPHFIASRYPALAPVLPDEVNILRSYWMNVTPEALRVPRVRALADFVRSLCQTTPFPLSAAAKVLR